VSGESALRYDHSLGLDGEDSLSVIARLISPGSTVLDLGASTGKLGLYLRDRFEPRSMPRQPSPPSQTTGSWSGWIWKRPP